MSERLVELRIRNERCNMWRRNGNVWYMPRMPRITVEPVRLFGGVIAWQAHFSGSPVEAIGVAFDSSIVREKAFEYFDARIDIGEDWNTEYTIAERGGGYVYA